MRLWLRKILNWMSRTPHRTSPIKIGELQPTRPLGQVKERTAIGMKHSVPELGENRTPNPCAKFPHWCTRLLFWIGWGWGSGLVESVRNVIISEEIWQFGLLQVDVCKIQEILLGNTLHHPISCLSGATCIVQSHLEHKFFYSFFILFGLT